MRRKLIERIVQAHGPVRLDRPVGSPGKRSMRQARTRSSTTILALRYADGILCAADRKISGYWFRIISMDMQKMFAVSPVSLLMGSGSVASIQEAERYVRRTCRQFVMQSGVPMSAEGQATMLAEWCSLQSLWLGDWFSFYGIFCGVDSDETFHLYSVEPDGCKLEEVQHYATGSGMYDATAVLDMRWEPDMNMAHALHIAVDAQYHAGIRDSGTTDVRLALPSAAIITAQGVQFIERSYILQALSSVLATKPNKPLQTPMELGLMSFSGGK